MLLRARCQGEQHSGHENFLHAILLALSQHSDGGGRRAGQLAHP